MSSISAVKEIISSLERDLATITKNHGTTILGIREDLATFRQRTTDFHNAILKATDTFEAQLLLRLTADAKDIELIQNGESKEH